MEFLTKVKRKIISGQTGEVIANVIHYIQQKAKKNTKNRLGHNLKAGLNGY